MQSMTTLPRPAGFAALHDTVRAVAMRRDILLFTAIVVAASFFLQRFGFPATGKAINIVGPIGLGGALLGLARGWLTFSLARLPMFLVLCLLTLAGLAYHQIEPGRYAVAPSLPSTLQFLGLSSFATLSFAQPVPERMFFRLVNWVAVLLAVAGILQFLAQFVGLRLFSFRGFVPDALLFEDGYNLQIPLGFGDLFKSNGFFMLEPSVFSQFMAIALIAEILVLQRLWFLALFTAAIGVSMAGTGWIVIASFVASVAFSMGRRGILVSVATLAVLATVVVAAALLAPDAAAAFTDRMDEVVRPGTSGHLRFVTPFWLLSDAYGQDPAAALLGLGGGVSERLMLPYEYDVNTPVKIAVEYGLPALAAYVLLLATGSKTATQRALIFPCLVLLMFTGGYQQFAPALFPILLIMSVARLLPEGARA